MNSLLQPVLAVMLLAALSFGQATATLANSLGVLSSLYQMGGARSLQFALKLIF